MLRNFIPSSGNTLSDKHHALSDFPGNGKTVPLQSTERTFDPQLNGCSSPQHDDDENF